MPRPDPTAQHRHAIQEAATQLIGGVVMCPGAAYIAALRELDVQYLSPVLADLVTTILTLHDCGERIDPLIFLPMQEDQYAAQTVFMAAVDRFTINPARAVAAYREAVAAIERYRLAEQSYDAARDPQRWAEWLSRCQEQAPVGVQTVDWTGWREQAAKPVRWIIENWLLSGTVTVLAAAGGTGKSNLALGLAVSAVTGYPIFPGLSVARGTVLYLDLENRDIVNMRRLAAYAERHLAAQNGYLDKSLASLHLHVGRGQFVQSTQGRSLTTTPYYAKVLEQVRRLKPDLIIIDHLRRIAGGAEQNSNEAMGLVLETCDRLALECESAVLLLAHQPKAALAPGTRPSQANVRGASSIVDEARCVWELRREGDLLLLSRVKCNEAPLTTQPLAFRFHPCAGSVCLCQDSTPPEFVPTKAPELDACVLDWIRATPDNTVTLRNVSNGTGSGGQLVDAIREHHPSVRPQDVVNSLQRLVNRHAIRIVSRTVNRHKRQGYEATDTTPPPDMGDMALDLEEDAPF